MEPRQRGQWRGRANFIIRVPPPIDFQMLNGALRLPPGLADGFGLKGTSPTRWREIHPLWWVPRSGTDSAVPPLGRSRVTLWQPVIVITITYYPRSALVSRAD